MTQRVDSYGEPELYVEPTPMGRKEVAGVIVAFLALTVIGIGGYIWLNPSLSMASLLEGSPKAEKPARVASVDKVEHQACPYCGMFADTSRAAVAAMWAGGGSGTFDSFDCVFNYMQENDKKLDSGTVKNYSPSTGDEWLDVRKAWYLYDTKAIVEGSMQPYVAAFVDKRLAEDARMEMGGQAVDFAGLEAKWKK